MRFRLFAKAMAASGESLATTFGAGFAAAAGAAFAAGATGALATGTAFAALATVLAVDFFVDFFLLVDLADVVLAPANPIVMATDAMIMAKQKVRVQRFSIVIRKYGRLQAKNMPGSSRTSHFLP